MNPKKKKILKILRASQGRREARQEITFNNAWKRRTSLLLRSVFLLRDKKIFTNHFPHRFELVFCVMKKAKMFPYGLYPIAPILQS
ncbi:CLUMA_CG018381, isoform A [Clunio marinus]|uniref:CLUMA_CG018381, isoform A n=1 Tax=Clunio marinus TaxID=568069 RepID=A0A1J1J2D1_9DIPT|nr:CLUMA_CG018381, isoform A [Clunio marinus]